MKLSRNKISKLLKIKEQSRKQYKKNKRQRKRGKSFRGKKHFNIRQKSIKKGKHSKYIKKKLRGGDINEKPSKIFQKIGEKTRNGVNLTSEDFDMLGRNFDDAYKM